jgi:uncharacterized membrane protein (DUF441 family)
MADVIKAPFGTGASDMTDKTTVNVGTAGTGVTAVEYGTASNHRTVLTVAVTAPSVTGSIGVGNLIYTFPAGAILVHGGSIKIGSDGVTGNHANTPEIGVGTVIASGAVTALNGTATFENIITAVTAANAGVVVPGLGIAELGILTADAHTVYLNIAAAWTGTDATMTMAGSVVIDWTYLEA